MTDLILFLDFDGTLHPNFEFIERPDGTLEARVYDGPRLIHAPLLASILHPWLDRIEVVISSWWAYRYPLADILAQLPEALACRVTGSIYLGNV